MSVRVMIVIRCRRLNDHLDRLVRTGARRARTVPPGHEARVRGAGAEGESPLTAGRPEHVHAFCAHAPTRARGWGRWGEEERSPALSWDRRASAHTASPPAPSRVRTRACGGRGACVCAYVPVLPERVAFPPLRGVIVAAPERGCQTTPRRWRWRHDRLGDIGARARDAVRRTRGWREARRPMPAINRRRVHFLSCGSPVTLEPRKTLSVPGWRDRTGASICS